MGPDLTLVAIFALGGFAVGLVTAFVGLSKAQELASWAMLYALIVTASTLLMIAMPFRTTFAACLAANLSGSVAQVAFLPWYRRNNPAYHEQLDQSQPRVIGWLFGFSLFEGVLFGIVAATTAWALSLL